MEQPKFKFKCASCDEWHEGIPAWGWNYPFHFHTIPEAEREERCFLTTDLCVVDDKAFYVCGCLELPVVGTEEVLSLRVWVSLSKENFFKFQDLLGVEHRSQNGPYFGWLSVPIPTYPETMNLKTQVHIRDHGIRPFIELERTAHPISLDQQHGVDVERIQFLYDYFEHRGIEG
ncbi:DUF2199 domain-containing protein [Roseateles microcysteis]|uniref:DUF2199 domain-containing protein n=1 Tax=Roseateles microcysteis TaxID=3119057 RepID=UPI002FE5C751